MRGRYRFFTPLLVAFLIVVADGQSYTTPRTLTYPQYIQSNLQTIVTSLQTSGDWGAAENSLQDLFDQAVLYAPHDPPDSLRESDYALRLVKQLRQCEASSRMNLLQTLKASPNLARELVFLIPKDVKPAEVYALLDELRQKRPKLLEPYASLTAAVCVVHHTPLEIRANENTAAAINPLDIFDYYIRNEGRMAYGIRNIPAELLAYVVDDAGSIDDMNWALNKYQGNSDLGGLYFAVAYDTSSFREGTTKKLTLAGFTLPNILRYGGICVDQAFFSSEVGKSIGIPTAIDLGKSGDTGHAWLGFLQTSRAAAWWNFDSGRYEEFKGVRGTVMDPLTHQWIPDTLASLTAEVAGTTPAQRQNAAALADAAERLMAMEKDQIAMPVPPQGLQPGAARPSPRQGEADDLVLLEAALHQSVGCSAAWLGVRDLAAADELTADEKNRWADLLVRFGASRYPDFTLSILGPIVESIPDIAQQDRAWQNLFTIFSARSDLAATIRMAEGSMWETATQPDNAATCYLDVIQRYANAGPFVISALKAVENLYIDAHRSDLILPLYARTWHSIELPREMAAMFIDQSNWYQVGTMYEERLREAGQGDRAAAVARQLKTRTVTAGT